MIDTSLAKFDADGMQTVFPISPFGASETRAERIARWEAAGFIDPACAGCRDVYAHPKLNPFQPQHKPGVTCGSGKRPHCTCPRCWG